MTTSTRTRRPARRAGYLAGLVAMVRLWQVFPFGFDGSSFDWAMTARIVLIAGLVGAAIGLLVQLVNLVRAGVRRPR